MYGTFPFVPGEVFGGIIFSGDKKAGEARRGQVQQLLQMLKSENVLDLPQYSKTMRWDDGSAITVRRQGSVYSAEVFVPESGNEQPEAPQLGKLVPDLEPGQFYWIPGCVARYDASLSPASPKADAVHWINSIQGSALVNEVLRYKSGVYFSSRYSCGLPSMQSMGDAGVSRDIGAYVLPGGVDSGMYLSKNHLPDNRTFSFSCAFRLNSKLEYDYTFDEMEVLNPVRSYYLKSSNGENWEWECPGSLSPVIGWASPQYFTSDQEHVTFPWAPWNDDFTNESLVTGLKAVDVACSDAPLLAGNWSASSPYWDKKDPPNAYPYPKGFITGMRFFGLFIYNGNQLLCGRVNNFRGQYQLSPIITQEIELGQWFHATVVQENDGVVNLYLANGSTKGATRYSVVSFIGGMIPPTAYDTEYDYAFIGYNSWFVELLATNEKISHFSMNPQIDVCLPRFYDRSITMAEAVLLHREALDGMFVADDFEVGQIEAAGFVPVMV